PFGTVPCFLLVCTAPVPSVARAANIVLPTVVGVHCHDQKTQESLESGGANVATFQVIPLSALTSTFSMPLLPAKAKPATSTGCPIATWPLGRSMRFIVCSGPLYHPWSEYNPPTK